MYCAWSQARETAYLRWYCHLTQFFRFWKGRVRSKFEGTQVHICDRRKQLRYVQIVETSLSCFFRHCVLLVVIIAFAAVMIVVIIVRTIAVIIPRPRAALLLRMRAQQSCCLTCRSPRWNSCRSPGGTTTRCWSGTLRRADFPALRAVLSVRCGLVLGLWRSLLELKPTQVHCRCFVSRHGDVDTRGRSTTQFQYQLEERL